MTASGHDIEATLDEVYRREVGRCTATLIRVLGDVDLAEDAVADAFAVAAQRWPHTGIPPNPGAWITTTARNQAIDRLRRESRRPSLEVAATKLDDAHDHAPTTLTETSGAEVLDTVADDQLRLIFLCCHPALHPDAQVALTLRLLGGLTTDEIADAFLVPSSTMGQRISRAKSKIRDTRPAYRIPPPERLEERLEPVLATVYLIYTTAHAAGPRDGRHRDLAAESIRLGRLLAELLPDEAEVAGLLALMLLTEARAATRVDDRGQLVLLADQDRRRWNRDLIDEGHHIVRACLALNQPGPYQVQAAIAAVHADAPTADATDWGQIVDLYDLLLALRPSAVVAINRAVAILEHAGPPAAIAALDIIDPPHSHRWHAVRAEALRRDGRIVEARHALVTAVGTTTNTTEREHLERELSRLA
ncbi:MAG: sigma-70 family RNA polymerase sigma factor [Actinomycetota bacterium]